MRLNPLDIVLIKPGSQKQIYGGLSDFQLTGIEPPFWASLLAGYLRKRGFSVSLLDAEAEGLSHEETAEIVTEMKPLLSAVVVSGTNPSASTMNMTGAGQIISHIRKKDPNMKTILGGLHPSALPQKTMMEEETDFLFQGEGFYTLPFLIDSLRFKTEKYNIPGLWYKQNGRINSNPVPPVMKDLKELPVPAWDLLPMKKYRAHNWHCLDNIENRQPYGILYTSLGCPFKCTFCCINSIFGNHMIRYRPTPDVIEDLDLLVTRYGIKNIKIMDEMFGLHEKRVTELCDAIIRKGYDLNIWAYARLNTVTPRMLSKMKQAGINWVAYGFESGSKKVIEDVHKGYEIETVKKIVQMTYDNGIRIGANFIFGLPEDDYVSMNETLQLMMDINAEWANIYCAMAYPGSELYHTAIRNNWPLPESWIGYSQYAYETLPLPTKYLTGSQVLAFRDKAFDRYYSNPRYLNMIEKKFNPEAAEHIRKMTRTRLKRKYAASEPSEKNKPQNEQGRIWN